MQRRCIPDVVFGALIAVAIFAMGFVVGSSQIAKFIKHPTEPETKYEAQGNKQTTSFLVTLRDEFPWDASTVANIIMAVFAGLLYCVTRKQSNQTEILERAYLTVNPGGVAPYADPNIGFADDGRMVTHIRVQNAGRLPARHVHFYFNMTFSDEPNWTEERLTKIDEPAEAANFGNNVIAPGSAINQGSPTRQIGKMETGWAYVWGVVEYDDGFTAGRKTTFCHRYNLKRIEPDKHGRRRIRTKYGRHYERGQGAT